MDKSFNDDELSDIMKEIEALEQDFNSPEEKLETSSLMEELAHMEEEEAIPTPTANPEPSTVLPMAAHKAAPTTASVPAANSSTAATSMSFKVSGDINLALQFDIGGKTVCLNVTEAGLNIEMDGGMSFKVPLSHGAHKKAA